jgi:hypothetical protein
MPIGMRHGENENKESVPRGICALVAQTLSFEIHGTALPP